MDPCADLRARLSRNYDVRQLTGLRAFSNWQIGDTGVQGVRGWVLTFHLGYPIAPLANSTIRYTFVLRQEGTRGAQQFPVPGLIGGPAKVLANVQIAEGGTVYIPWNSIGVFAQGTPGVEIFLRAEPHLTWEAPPPFSTCLYGRQNLTVAAGVTAAQPLAAGTTRYQVSPAEQTPFRVREQTTLPAPVLWADYLVDPGVAVAPGIVGEGWRTVPPQTQAELLLGNLDVLNARQVAILSEYDTGAIR
jgi:hypothetical protein